MSSTLNNHRLPPSLRSRSAKEAIAEDIAPYVGMTPEQRGRIVDQLSRLAIDLVKANPNRDQVLAWQEPVPESTRVHWRRLMLRGR